MTNKKLREIKKDNIGKILLSFVPNELGINLCSVDDIDIVRQENGELKSITIRFIPDNPELSKNTITVHNYSSAVPC